MLFRSEAVVGPAKEEEEKAVVGPATRVDNTSQLLELQMLLEKLDQLKNKL